MTKKKKRRVSNRVSLRTADILLKLQETSSEFDDEQKEEDEDIYDDYKFMVAGNEDEDDDAEGNVTYDEYNEDLR